MSFKENFFVSCLGQFLQNNVNKVNASHDSLLVSTTFRNNAIVVTILRSIHSYLVPECQIGSATTA